METIKTKIASSGDRYPGIISWSFDGFANNHDYLIDMTTESQNIGGGIGMIQDTQKLFNINYGELIILNKPIVTQNQDTSGININWASLCQNPANIVGGYNYISNFIKYGNTALNLNMGTTLVYNSTVMPSNGTFPFMIKIPKTFDGIMFTTLDSKYQVGYNNSQQKFYSLIDGITNYSELIKITENPFNIYMLPDRIIIKQYNVYNMVNTSYNLNVKDMYDLPVNFMIQQNN